MHHHNTTMTCTLLEPHFGNEITNRFDTKVTLTHVCNAKRVLDMRDCMPTELVINQGMEIYDSNKLWNWGKKPNEM
jgi:hypothetical protein